MHIAEQLFRERRAGAKQCRSQQCVYHSLVHFSRARLTETKTGKWYQKWARKAWNCPLSLGPFVRRPCPRGWKVEALSVGKHFHTKKSRGCRSRCSSID